MMRPGIGVAIALSLAVAQLADAKPSDSTQVRQTFARFVKALGERDADAGLELVSQASYSEWERDRALALYGARAEVAAQPPGRRLAVMALRHHAPKFLAHDGTPRELVGYALRAGLADRNVLAAIEVGDVVVQGERASAQLFASGLPSGFRAGFVREDGAWKLDLPSTLDAAGRVVTRSAAAADASEDSLIAGLLLLSSGTRPTAQIWQPLANSTGAADAAH